MDTTRILIHESIYHQDIDLPKLEVQLQMLPDLLKAFEKPKNVTNLTITKVTSVTEMLTVVPMVKDMFSEVNKLLRLYSSDHKHG